MDCPNRAARALRIAFILCIGVLATLVSNERAFAAKAATETEASVVQVVKAAMPAVVNVSTTRRVRSSPEENPLLNDPFFRHFFGEQFPRQFDVPRQRREMSLGSGVIVDASGIIITNYHVVAKADVIKVALSDKREFTGKVIGSDPQTDIALVKINATNLPTLRWGDSDKLQVAQTVFAIGIPFGLTQTVTSGIVSAVGRANVGIADYEDFIQTDAAINPGNSGGALINTKGELIGINTAIFSQSGGYMGIGFAVPSNMARDVMQSLIKTGKVARGWLGVSIQELTPELATQFGLKEANGALVSDIVEGSPAAQAGLKTGDVIVGYDGKEITSPGLLRNLVAQTPAGKEVSLRVMRDKKLVTVPVRIAEQPKEIAQRGARTPAPGEEGEESGLAGVQVRSLTPEIARQLGLEAAVRGVVVTAVDPNSPAADAGLQPGDVVTEVEHQPVRDLESYRQAVAKLGSSKSVLLLVNRGGEKRYVVVER
jgi:serine protease Do